MNGRHIASLLILIFALSTTSCTVNSIFVQKRKYRKGYHVEVIKKDNKKPELSKSRECYKDIALKCENIKPKEDKDDSFRLQQEKIIKPKHISTVPQNKSKSTAPESYLDNNDLTIFKGINKVSDFFPKKRIKQSNIPASDDDPTLNLAKKAFTYFFLGFIPYAGTVFGILSFIFAIVAFKRADESSDPDRVRSLTRWIIILNIILLALNAFLLTIFILIGIGGIAI